MKQIMYAIFIILFLPFVFSATLSEYYPIDTTQNTTWNDVHQGHNLTIKSGGEISSIIGKIGNASLYTGLVSGSKICGNLTLGQDWAVNTWYYHNGTTNTQYPINITSGERTTYTRYQTATNTLRLYHNGTELYRFTGDANGNATTTTWHMHTITYYFGYVSYYYDGVLQNTTTMQSHLNPVTLCLGTNLYDGYDELSIYNSTLTQIEINQLYNLGNGINYTETDNDINIPTPVQNGCTDNNTYCTNIQYNPITETYFCYYEDTEHCSGGCSGDIGSAVCDNNCVNECDILSSRGCIDSTIYYTCEDVDADGCYDKNPTACNSGEYCRASGNYFATCESVPSLGISNNTAFTIVAYAVNDNATSYNNQQSLNTIDVYTSRNTHTQRFYTMATASTFSSRICDYKETQIYQNTAIPSINQSKSFTIPSVNTISYVSLNILPINDTNVTIIIQSSIGAELSHLVLYRDVTAKSLCINMVNGSSIYCDLSTNTYDDLNNFGMIQTFDFVSNTYTITMLFDRATDNTEHTYPFTFSGTDISYVIINTTNATMTNLSVYKIPQPNGFSQTIPDDASYIPCLFDAVASYNVRTYNNVNGYPDYTNYRDYTVNVKALGLDDADIDNLNAPETPQDEGWKMFLLIAILLIVFLLFFIIGISMNMPKPMIITGIIFDMVLLVCATIPSFPGIGGIFPKWALVMVGLVALALSVLIVIKFNPNSGG